MCTLTFVPAEDGYLAGMNRDELLARAAALPPGIFTKDEIKALYPREPSGGTWIACNSHGNLLALLNWNEIDTRFLGQKQETRGVLIPKLILESDVSSTGAQFDRLPLDGIFPFRLIGVFSKERRLQEWRWDGVRRQKLDLPWERKHWFSSSLSDAAAEKGRGSTCESAATNIGGNAAGWLGRLHRSHIPAPGPFSICVHRQDAATVSYTGVTCSGSSISMSYLSGNPCRKQVFDTVASLPLREPRIATAPA